MLIAMQDLFSFLGGVIFYGREQEKIGIGCYGWKKS